MKEGPPSWLKIWNELTHEAETLKNSKLKREGGSS